MRRWLARASLILGGVGLLAALSACRKNADEASTVANDAGAADVAGKGAVANDEGENAAPQGGSSAAAPAGSLVPSTQRACRVISVRGDAMIKVPVWSAPSAEGGVGPARSRFLRNGELLPEGGIVELGSGVALTVASTVSTREMTIVGPAFAEACPKGEEVVRLSRGKVTSFPGAGVRPGAEVWVATPLGVVRFNDAKTEIDVTGADAERLEVNVVTGQATFVPAVGVTLAPLDADAEPRRAPAPKGADVDPKGGGTIALAPGTTIAASRPQLPVARWARDLLTSCARKSAAAREAGQRMAGARGSNRASLADLAAAHVQARQLARVACEAARAAAALPPGQLDAAQRAELDRADETWKAVPPAPSSAPASSGKD